VTLAEMDRATGALRGNQLKSLRRQLLAPVTRSPAGDQLPERPAALGNKPFGKAIAQAKQPVPCLVSDAWVNSAPASERVCVNTSRISAAIVTRTKCSRTNNFNELNKNHLRHFGQAFETTRF
jgi:hypothetical protein